MAVCCRCGWLPSDGHHASWKLGHFSELSGRLWTQPLFLRKIQNIHVRVNIYYQNKSLESRSPKINPVLWLQHKISEWFLFRQIFLLQSSLYALFVLEDSNHIVCLLALDTKISPSFVPCLLLKPKKDMLYTEGAKNVILNDTMIFLVPLASLRPIWLIWYQYLWLLNW